MRGGGEGAVGGTLYRVTSRSCSRCPTGQGRENEHLALGWPQGEAGSLQVSAQPLRNTVRPVLAGLSPGACHLASGLILHPPSAQWVGIYTVVGGSGPVFSLLLPVRVLFSTFPPERQ